MKSAFHKIILLAAFAVLTNCDRTLSQTAAAPPAKVLFTIQDFRKPNQTKGYYGLIRFSPNDKLLAASVTNGNINIYDAATGKLQIALDAGRNGYRAFSFSPDAMQAAAQTFSYEKIKTFDLQTGKVLREFDALERSTAGKKGIIKVLQRPTLNFEILPIVTDADWKTILTAENDNRVLAYDIQTGAQKFVLDQGTNSNAIGDTIKIFTVGGYIAWINAERSPNGKTVLVSNGNFAPRLWNVADGKLIAELGPQPKRVYTAFFSPDGKLIATSNRAGTVKIWDASNGKLLREFAAGKEELAAREWSPDSQILVTTTDKNAVELWNAETAQMICKLDTTGKQKDFLDFKLTAVQNYLFTRDGKILVTNSADKDFAAHLWNAADGRLIASLPREKGEDYPEVLAWSPNGKFLVTASLKEAKLWNARGELLQKLDSAALPAQFTGNGKLLATGGLNDRAFVWQIEGN